MLKLSSRLENRSRIFKTHLTREEVQTGGYLLPRLKNAIFNRSLVVYIYRDGRDVLVSEYMRKISEKAISQDYSIKFYLRRFGHDRDEHFAKMWVRHIASWGLYEGNILHVDYAQLINSPVSFLKELADRAEAKFNPENFKDMRMDNWGDKVAPPRFGNGPVSAKGESRTSVMFRKGEIGDYKNYFDEYDCDYFYGAVVEEMNHVDVTTYNNHFNMDWLARFAPNPAS